MKGLVIRNLHVSVDGNEILKGVNLKVGKGEIVAIMGPNGSGKSTLAYALMGHPSYAITAGTILFNGKDITKLSPDKRGRLGLFLSFQYPQEIPGVSVANFLRTAVNSKLKRKMPVSDFLKMLREKMLKLKISEKFAQRYLNEGFSGGEKKRAEILQLAMLKPGIAILDETDSGTDVDALKTLSKCINSVKRETGMGVLMITHYNRILNYVKPGRVVVMINGRIVKEGSHKLAEEIEKTGYEAIGR